MEQFYIKNTLNDSITISYASSDYILHDYSGLTAGEIIPVTSLGGYNQIGLKFRKNKIGVRLINLYFYIYGQSMADLYEKRRFLSKLFNPALEGESVLIYTNDYISKSISVSVSTQPEVIEKNGNLQLISVELIAHNPLWRDNAINSVKLGGFIGGLRFPLKFEGSGLIFAEKGSFASIDINGDVSSPILAEFRNSSVNPKLINATTGEFIQVDTTIDNGEKLIINTAYGNKTVTHVTTDGIESSAYHLITDESKFFSLPFGKNDIYFDATSGDPEIFISWYNWFMGV